MLKLFQSIHLISPHWALASLKYVLVSDGQGVEEADFSEVKGGSFQVGAIEEALGLG